MQVVILADFPFKIKILWNDSIFRRLFNYSLNKFYFD